MKHIVFRYKDKDSNGQWNTQECFVESREKCIEIYGLDKDPDVYDWEILKEEDVPDENNPLRKLERG